jgi:hypothetical protein
MLYKVGTDGNYEHLKDLAIPDTGNTMCITRAEASLIELMACGCNCFDSIGNGMVWPIHMCGV